MRPPRPYLNQKLRSGHPDWPGGLRPVCVLKLLAVALAMVCEDTILILDEATLNLDLNPEAALYSAIEEYAENRTVLFVSHRLSII